MAGLLPGDLSHHGMFENGLYSLAQDKPEEISRWYLSRREIEENSPSRRDGIDLKKETYLRKSYCTFLQDLGMRLKVPQVTIATAIIFCHRFFLHQSHAKNDRRTIATVCMFLAGKVEETPRPLKDVILVSYEIINKKDSGAMQRIKQKEVYEQQKELILTGERVVLATLGFDFNVNHPYKPLVEAIKKFKVATNSLAQVAWNFVNDGLRTSLCLQFKPHHIAAGAIFLAAKFLKVKLPSDGEKVWWQEFDVTPRQLEEVSNQMLELYEQNRVPQQPQGSEFEGSAGGPSYLDVSKPPASIESVSVRASTSEIRNLDTVGEVSKRSGFGLVKHSEEVRERNDGRSTTTESEERKKDGSSSQNLDSSPRDHIKKLDKDKVKAALEKRRKSRGADLPPRKIDPVDEDDLIERELEDGVELAAEDEKYKQSWSKSGNRRDHESPSYDGKDYEDIRDGPHDVENVEEGEFSLYEEADQGYRSPDPLSRKRKVGSPEKHQMDGWQGRNYKSQDIKDDRSRSGRPGYTERDHKRHLHESHI
ncbi:hypothetical protein GIB67_005523 [Kingdonia uniflora]|uniref:Cyclin-like domain-containing protein n=1 Tax=Kingdonia uniflora TaxID=39325 RepID=A0A7J7NHE1_9MAGN|nr:hypothetical protein GIB67_005523 [Kingdonia uniflora]